MKNRKVDLKRVLAIAFCAMLISVSCKKDEEPISNKEEFEEFLMEEMEDQHIPALATLVFENEEVLYESYLGKSNLETNAALGASDKFLLASVSKVTTGAALLILYDQGKFSLDDPINDYLDFEVNIPDYSNKVTFRMLLTHTSAIADGAALDDEYYYGKDSPVELEQFMKDYFVPGGQHYDDVDNFYAFEPGTEHEYSNTGSALIGVLVEQISGMSFNSFCKENIFTPLGMSNTYWRLDEVDGTIVQPYDFAQRENQKIEHYTFTDYPNGGLRSTVRDMHKLLYIYANEGVGISGHRLLTSSTVDEICTVQVSDDDNEVGLHFFLMVPDEELWGHDGSEQGVATIMAVNRSNGVGALLFANQGKATLDDLLIEAYEFGLEIK